MKKNAPNNSHAKLGMIIIGALVIVMLIFALFVTGLPQTAFNKIFNKPTFTTSSVAISANVNLDSSISVTDYRTMQLDENTTCIKWKYDDLNENSRLDMREVRMSFLDAQGNATDTREYSLVTFKKEWRATNGHDGKGPGAGTYAID